MYTLVYQSARLADPSSHLVIEIIEIAEVDTDSTTAEEAINGLDPTSDELLAILLSLLEGGRPFDAREEDSFGATGLREEGWFDDDQEAGFREEDRFDDYQEDLIEGGGLLASETDALGSNDDGLLAGNVTDSATTPTWSDSYPQSMAETNRKHWLAEGRKWAAELNLPAPEAATSEEAYDEHNRLYWLAKAKRLAEKLNVPAPEASTADDAYCAHNDLYWRARAKFGAGVDQL